MSGPLPLFFSTLTDQAMGPTGSFQVALPVPVRSAGWGWGGGGVTMGCILLSVAQLATVPVSRFSKPAGVSTSRVPNRKNVSGLYGTLYSA